MSARIVDGPAFAAILSRAASLIDQGYHDRVAADQLQDAAARCRAECERLQQEVSDLMSAARDQLALVDALRADGQSLRGECGYWRTRAALMIRALRLWQKYDATLAGNGAAGARMYAAAVTATQEAFAAISPAGVQ